MASLLDGSLPWNFNIKPPALEVCTSGSTRTSCDISGSRADVSGANHSLFTKCVLSISDADISKHFEVERGAAIGKLSIFHGQNVR